MCVCGAQGDRLVVLRFFEALAFVLQHGAVPADGPWRPAAFDWGPRPVRGMCGCVGAGEGECIIGRGCVVQLPDALLASLLPVPAETMDEGIKAIVQLIDSVYDDVAVNGCSSTAKLATANESTRVYMARHVPLVQALVTVLCGTLSTDTRSNAALSLSVLVDAPGAVLTLVGCLVRGGVPVVRLLADICRTDDGVETACLRRYWYVRVGTGVYSARVGRAVCVVFFCSAEILVTLAWKAPDNVALHKEGVASVMRGCATDCYGPLRRAAAMVLEYLGC